MQVSLLHEVAAEDDLEVYTYIDLVIYSAIFSCNRLLGFMLLCLLASAVWFNIHDAVGYQTIILVLCSLTLFKLGGSNYKILAALFMTRALLFTIDNGLANSMTNHFMVVFQIIIAIDTDDTGSGKGTYGKLYAELQMRFKLNSSHSLMHYLYCKSCQRFKPNSKL